MKAKIETQIDIKSTPEKVWEVLIQTSRYPSWNPFVKSLSGTLKVGERIRIQLPGMRFKPVVTGLEVNKRFSWLGKLFITGIFDGHHQFELKDNGDFTTLIHKEDFKGILVKWFMKNKLEETRIQFEQMNLALKRRVERDADF